ncbi:MAG: DUF6786 family protein [Verrucomicrobiota bacterium]
MTFFSPTLFIILLSIAWVVAQPIPHSFKNDAQLFPDGIILSDKNRKVLISPQHQGTVCVSTLDGESLGFLNRDAIRSGNGGIGGADRFWFAPDGSQFTVFFEPGAELTEDNWRVAPGVATGSMRILTQTDGSVDMDREIELQNHLGTSFKTRIRRTVTLLPSDSDLPSVAFRVENTVTNLGPAWDADTGLLAIWNLSSFAGGPEVEVQIPLPQTPEVRSYFTPFQKDQLTIENQLARFRCNGNWRSKIGLPATSSLGIFYSLDPARKLLTIVRYQRAVGTRYPHSERGHQDKPYQGDLVQVYNHGRLDRQPLPQPSFYEMESVSPMKELQTGESITHWQEIRHYRGSKKELDAIIKKWLAQEQPVAGNPQP